MGALKGSARSSAHLTEAVQRTILRLAFPGGNKRPKPGPYEGPAFRTAGEREIAELAGAAS